MFIVTYQLRYDLHLRCYTNSYKKFLVNYLGKFSGFSIHIVITNALPFFDDIDISIHTMSSRLLVASLTDKNKIRKFATKCIQVKSPESRCKVIIVSFA